MRVKRPRKFTRAEKIYISSLRLNCNSWLFLMSDGSYWHIKSKAKGQIRRVPAPTK